MTNDLEWAEGRRWPYHHLHCRSLHHIDISTHLCSLSLSLCNPSPSCRCPPKDECSLQHCHHKPNLEELLFLLLLQGPLITDLQEQRTKTVDIHFSSYRRILEPFTGNIDSIVSLWSSYGFEFDLRVAVFATQRRLFLHWDIII